MKTKHLLITAIAFVFVLNSAKAQNIALQNVEPLKHDLLIIADNFAAPAAEGAAFQASSGWFTSGKELGKWKVDLSLQGNVLFVPSGKKQKLVSNRDFSILKIKGNTNALAPTVYGGKTDIQYEGLDQPIDAIDGLNRGALIHPFIQATLGLPYGTDLAVRYLPEMTIDNVQFGTFGVGLKHNFSQYFIRHARPDDFEFAAVVTYTNFKVNYAFLPLNVKLQNIQLAELNRVDVNANLWLAQLLGSKRYDNFEVFAALGVVNSKFDYSLAGKGKSFIQGLNTELDKIGDTDIKFKGDLGFNYYIGDSFKVSTMFTASSFFNANLGFHYIF